MSPRVAYTLDNYPATAVASTLSAAVNASATSFNISPATSWSASNLWAVIDRSDNPASASGAEEHVWIQTNSAGALADVVRGLGGVGAVAHAAGAPIEVIASGVALAEMSRAVAEILGTIRGGAIGDLLYADNVTAGAEGFARLADVATGSVVRSGGVGAAPLYGKVRQAELDAGLRLTYAQTSAPAQSDGDVWVDTDSTGTSVYVSDGTTHQEIGRHGAWETYTPTFRFGSTAWTLGDGTLDARYIRLGRTIHVYVAFQIGSTTNFNAGTGDLSISLPVNSRHSATVANVNAIGSGFIRDESVPANALLMATLEAANQDRAMFRGTSNTTTVTNTSPHAGFGAASDEVQFSATYEAAS